MVWKMLAAGVALYAIYVFLHVRFRR